MENERKTAVMVFDLINLSEFDVRRRVIPANAEVERGCQPVAVKYNGLAASFYLLSPDKSGSYNAKWVC